MFINAMAKIGWAYELKTVNKDVIDSRMSRTGDGTKTSVWGWADPDQSKDDFEITKIISKKTN